jgi:hypothetical protein
MERETKKAQRASEDGGDADEAAWGGEWRRSFGALPRTRETIDATTALLHGSGAGLARPRCDWPGDLARALASAAALGGTAAIDFGRRRRDTSWVVCSAI